MSDIDVSQVQRVDTPGVVGADPVEELQAQLAAQQATIDALLEALGGGQ